MNKIRHPSATTYTACVNVLHCNSLIDIAMLANKLLNICQLHVYVFNHTMIVYRSKAFPCFYH